jgi:hypothetical protein
MINDYCLYILTGGDHSSDSDADHHYEMLYEVVGDNNVDAGPYDDFDSFDSDVSDETYIKPLHQVEERARSSLLLNPCINCSSVFYEIL